MKNYDGFCGALNNLKCIYECKEPYSYVEMMGILGLFCVCFDMFLRLASEIIKEDADTEDVIDYSKSMSEKVLKTGIIKDKDLWLSALKSREDALEAFDKNSALEIVGLIKEQYYDMLDGLKTEIDNNWKTI